VGKGKAAKFRMAVPLLKSHPTTRKRMNRPKVGIVTITCEIDILGLVI
jgi:hypothetical protein